MTPIKYTGEISITPRPGPTAQELEVLRAIVDEGKKAGVRGNPLDGYWHFLATKVVVKGGKVVVDKR